MRASCDSDVKLLKAWYQKFNKELKRNAEFDLIEMCITILSACNRVWRKKLLTPNTIATGPI